MRLAMPGRRVVTFSVQTCHKAVVRLSIIPEVVTRQTYEVVIGVNGTSCIFHYDAAGVARRLASSDVRDLVRCDRMLDFWLDWRSGGLRVGKGELSGDSFMSTQADVPVVNSLAISSGLESSGDWRFRQVEGKSWYR